MPIVNVGLGQPKKRSMPPPPFGGGQDDSGPAAPFGPKKVPPRPAPEAPPEPNAPAESAGGDIAPEAVCYRSEVETCGNCTYNANGQCDRLKIPVSDGDSCNLFEDKGGGSMDMESTEGEAPDAAME